MSENKKKLSLFALIMMIFTSVYGFTNITRSYYLMGYAAIPWYIFAGLAFFLPFSFIIAEFGAAFKDAKGGIYSWMEKSSGMKYAFVVIFIWYASFIIWQVNVGSGIWIVLSNAIFGVDKTQEWSIFGLSSVQTLGLLAISWIIMVTFLSTKGMESVRKITSVGGTAVMAINAFLWIGGILIFILNGGVALEPITAQAFFTSPNPSYHTLIKVLSFVVYAVFAYGGIEVLGGLVDETENAEVNFPRGVTIASFVITIGYAVGLFLFGLFTNWDFAFQQYPDAEVTLGNVSYIAMNHMGYQMGLAFGLAEAGAKTLGLWVARYMGISMFLSLTGAFFTLVFSPLKQLIGGTPKELWPKSWTVEKNGVHVNAMWYQAATVIALIALVSFGGKSASKFFEILVNMTNVSMSLPYFFIAYSFTNFKKDESIVKPFVKFKSMSTVKLVVFVVCTVVGLANIFTIIEPAITQGDYMTSFYSIAGPAFFAGVALFLYNQYEKRMGIK